MFSSQGQQGEVKRIDQSHLSPLRVLIYRGEEVVGKEDLPDPRIAYVAAFNEQAREFGLTARAG